MYLGQCKQDYGHDLGICILNLKVVYEEIKIKKTFT